MASTDPSRFSGPVTVLHDRPLPEQATPAGYSALIDAYGLSVAPPHRLHATGDHHRVVVRDGWRILTPRHAPTPDLAAHLTFALKYEGLDLAVLKRLFLAVGPASIQAFVRRAPTGAYGRRAWFLYEWLTGQTLDLPDAKSGRYVPALDPDQQYAVSGRNSPRHRVIDNLPGTPAFCPLVFRTDALERFIAMDLKRRAQDHLAAVPRDVLARTAAFLLLKDSRSSYAIEGERAPQDRIQRWGRAIGEAGRRALDLDELLRLQKIVIGDARFISLGLRTEGGFVGEHDRSTRMPLPEHVSARPEDLGALIAGLIAFDKGAARELDPVIAAAMLAFGFVYIHPFEDGNGRLHRYLIHHMLAQRGFNPPGVVFPVSSAILERLDGYRDVLERHSRLLLPLIEWEETPKHNVRVLNDTADFYRFFDATPHAEFLYACVRQTVEEDLPYETDYLRRHDIAIERIMNRVEMPDRLASDFVLFVRQNDGTLPRRRREREFALLSDEEARDLEAIVRDAFEGFDHAAEDPA